MENQLCHKNNWLYKWLISGLIVLMLACNSLSTPMVKSLTTTSNPTSESLNSQIPAPLASQLPNKPGINFFLSGVTNQPSQNGWNPSEAKIAVQNEGNSSVFLAYKDNNSSMYRGNFIPNLQIIHLYTDSSYVLTSEGNQYPFDYIRFARPVIIIPGGFTISGVGGQDLFTIQYKTPELLHPSKLVLSPGIAFENGSPKQITIDISDNIQKPQMPLNTTTLENLPASFQTGDKVSVAVDNPAASMVDYFWSKFSLSVPFTIQNKDITGNQPIGFEYFIVDNNGQMFSGDALPGSIGPGQTVTTAINFVLPPSESFSSKEYYLRIINDTLDNTYRMQSPSLPNCVFSGKPPAYIFPSISANPENINLEIPGSITHPVDNQITHIIHFEGVAGDLLRIGIEYDGAPFLWFTLNDPSGQTVISGSSHIGNWQLSNGDWINSLSSIPIICNGEYIFYYSFSGEDSSTYTVTIDKIENP
jgi:hypothetical protein